jgi:hypothetical protein
MTADETPEARSAEAESDAYWQEICAGMPPMSDDDIAAVAVILRQIADSRRNGVPPE